MSASSDFPWNYIQKCWRHKFYVTLYNIFLAVMCILWEFVWKGFRWSFLTWALCEQHPRMCRCASLPLSWVTTFSFSEVNQLLYRIRENEFKGLQRRVNREGEESEDLASLPDTMTQHPIGVSGRNNPGLTSEILSQK